MSYRISLSNKSSSVTFVVCIFGEMLHTMHNFLQEKLRACNDTRRAAAEAALKQQQQVRTKLPPDRHSERRFLLLLPSLPLTEGAAPRASIPKQKKKGKILITLALNLSLSLYESKRVRNKIVERRHLSASFHALERAPRVFLLFLHLGIMSSSPVTEVE